MPLAELPVTEMSLMAMDPWSVFIAWKAPEGSGIGSIKEYYLEGDVQSIVPKDGKYMFYYADQNIKPDYDFVVTITVGYDSGQNSTQKTKMVTTPKPSTFRVYILLFLRK